MANKPKLTRELLSELAVQLEKRQAEQLEKIRKAVAASTGFLSPEPLKEMLHLSPRDFEEVLREHPGFR